jgi:thymidylate kinase
MGFLLEKSIIIEFNGLPATGKTTIANALVSLLEEDGIQCVRHFLKHKWQKNGRTVFLSPKLFRLFVILKRFADSIKPPRNRFTHIMGEMYHYRSYRDLLHDLKDKRVFIVDQGLIQSIISIAHTDRILDEDSLKKVVSYYCDNNIEFFCVNCKVDPNLSFERIRNRPDNTARMHQIPREQLLDAMKMQAVNFDMVRRFFSDRLNVKVVNIDTELDPADNARIIYNAIKNSGFIKQ